MLQGEMRLAARTELVLEGHRAVTDGENIDNVPFWVNIKLVASTGTECGSSTSPLPRQSTVTFAPDRTTAHTDAASRRSTQNVPSPANGTEQVHRAGTPPVTSQTEGLPLIATVANPGVSELENVVGSILVILFWSR